MFAIQAENSYSNSFVSSILPTNIMRIVNKKQFSKANYDDNDVELFAAAAKWWSKTTQVENNDLPKEILAWLI